MDGYIEVDNNQLKLAIKVYESDSFGYNISQTAYFLLTINDTHPTIQELVEQKIYHIANKMIEKEDEEKAQKKTTKNGTINNQWLYLILDFKQIQTIIPTHIKQEQSP